jgi:hypothetical protein
MLKMARWLVAALLLTCCAPYIPVQEPAHGWNRMVEAETKDITVRLQHVGYQFNYLVFDLEVVNKASHDLLLSPHQQVFYYAASKPFPVHDRPFDIRLESSKHSRLTSQQLYAEAPSAVLNKVDKKVKSQAAAQAFLMVVGVGLAVYDGVKDVKDSQKEKWTYKDAGKAAGRNALVQTALVSSDMAGISAAQMKEESLYLPYEIFPDATLMPHECKRGKLFFPLETNYRYLRIIISAERTDYVFDFKTAGTH